MPYRTLLIFIQMWEGAVDFVVKPQKQAFLPPTHFLLVSALGQTAGLLFRWPPFCF